MTIKLHSLLYQVDPSAAIGDGRALDAGLGVDAGGAGGLAGEAVGSEWLTGNSIFDYGPPGPPTTIFDSLANVDDDSAPLGGEVLAQSFTTGTVASQIGTIDLVLWDSVPSDGGTVTFTVMSNNSNHPGSVVETLAVDADSTLSSSVGTVTLAVNGGSTLSANTRYWIEATGNVSSNAQWDYCDDPNTGIEVLTEYTSFNGDSIADTIGGCFLAEISTQPACFAAGTRILTARGPVAVDHLGVGDLVMALRQGGFVPVQWVGQRLFLPARTACPADFYPVRIRRDAFAPGQPARDLLVSPDHALFWEGHFVSARYLVNGASIVQEECERVRYFHVQLARHEVLLAENLPAESFLDVGNKAAFECGEAALAFDSARARDVWDQQACAPSLHSLEQRAGVRAHLLRRALALGYRLVADEALAVWACGRRILPQWAGRRARFVLPPRCAELIVSSRRIAPNYIGGEDEDGRVLGVGVLGVALDGCRLGLSSPAFAGGWHAPEPAIRWSNGAGTLTVDGARCLELDLLPALRYWEEEEVAARRVA
jgi:hypothetical protein